MSLGADPETKYSKYDNIIFHLNSNSHIYKTIILLSIIGFCLYKMIF